MCSRYKSRYVIWKVNLNGFSSCIHDLDFSNTKAASVRNRVWNSEDLRVFGLPFKGDRKNFSVKLIDWCRCLYKMICLYNSKKFHNFFFFDFFQLFRLFQSVSKESKMMKCYFEKKTWMVESVRQTKFFVCTASLCHCIHWIKLEFEDSDLSLP